MTLLSAPFWFIALVLSVFKRMVMFVLKTLGYLVLTAFIGLFGWYAYMMVEGAIFKSKDPVVVKDGTYWFPLRDHVFAVPERYVKSYERHSTDGALSSFELHALLPDFQGRSPENLAQFKRFVPIDRISITVNGGHHISREEKERSDYYNRYLLEKKSAGTSGDPVIASENPHVEKITWMTFDGLVGTDYFYLIEGDRVLKEIWCSMPKEEGKPGGALNALCRNYSIYYADNVRLMIMYRRAYEKDWVKIDDQVVDFIKSFERPRDAFPQSSH